MNVLKTNKNLIKNVCNVISRSYGTPYNVLNPLLAPGHMNAVCLEEVDPDALCCTVPKPKVIIIGAGIAGLSVANHLESSGIQDYLILEAKDRVGGRINTAWMSNRDVDLGAEWILGAGLNNSVSQLAAEEGIFTCFPKEKPPCEQAYLTTDGRVISPHVGLVGCTAFRDIEKCARNVFASNDPSCFGDLQTFFAIRIQQLLHGFPKAYQYDAERVMYGQANHLRFFLGGSLSDIDTRLYGSRNFLSGVKQRVPNGFKRILNPLLKSIPSSNISLAKPVRKICSHSAERGCPRVTVICCDGDEFKADYVICTIPLAALKLDASTLFDPHLPEEKLAALSSIKNGICNKVLLEYSNPFWAHGHGTIRLAWSPEELDNRDDWTKGISLFEEVVGTNDILCCYVAGREAHIMEQCNLQDVAESVTFVLRKFFGDASIPYPSRIMRSAWATDVYAGAATYYLSADSQLKHFEVVSSPYGPDGNAPTVFFAGDAFRADYLGTAHGARASGIDTANKLIKLHKELYSQSAGGEAPCGFSVINKFNVQDETAKKIKNYTKCLYDYTKKIEEADHLDGGDALAELITENFDEEQIWQQIELQNEARLKALVSDIASVVARKDRLCEEEKGVPLTTSTEVANDFADSEENEDQEKEFEGEEDDENLEDEIGDVDDEDDSEIEERLKSILHRKEQELKERGEFESDDDEEDEDLFADKRKKKTQRVTIIPSQVDDKFFKLSEMKNYLELMEREHAPEDDDPIDLMEPMSSGEESEDEQSSGKKSIKYNDFFDAPVDEPGSSKSTNRTGKRKEKDDVEVSDEENDDDGTGKTVRFEEQLGDESGKDHEHDDGAKNTDKAVRFKPLLGSDDTTEDSESEDEKKSKIKSSFETRQERLNAKIKHLEDELLAEKPWQLKGEVSANARPENALLEEDLEFDQMTREAPIITEKTSMRLEDIIKQRIKDKSWDDVERKVRPVETTSEFKKKLVLDQEKSKLSLAQIYEQEYLNKVAAATPNAEEKPEEIPKEHQEITTMFNSLFRKLDALCNFHFTPKMINPEAKIITNVPAIQMEEVAPVSTSDATLLAPEEVKERPRGDIVGKEERTDTDKKRERRKKKTRQRVHAREKEKRENAVAKLKPGLGNKYSKEKAIKDLERISKDANVDLIDGTSSKQHTKSSTAFFTQLQDQVKSQIKQQAQPSKRSKPGHQMSAKRIKL